MQLSDYQISEIYCAYQAARECDSGASNRTGEHAVLISILHKLGFYPGNVLEAYDLCEKILWG